MINKKSKISYFYSCFSNLENICCKSFRPIQHTSLNANSIKTQIYPEIFRITWPLGHSKGQGLLPQGLVL
jgi:hypothetical protein